MLSPTSKRASPPPPAIKIPTPPKSPESSPIPSKREEIDSSRTPLSATLPSALPKSPAVARLEVIKQEEEDLKTPITPPTAYTDFLKALSPALTTPSTGRSPMFDRLHSGKSTPLTQPNSAASSTASCTIRPVRDIPAPLKTAVSAPMIPPSPYMRPPHSARTPTSLRKLRIPHSPVWSPASDSPRSASATRSPYASGEWNPERMKRIYESPRSATGKPVSVRQVVTRTVTYTRTPITPLDPAPKGKKRRVE